MNCESRCLLVATLICVHKCLDLIVCIPLVVSVLALCERSPLVSHSARLDTISNAMINKACKEPTIVPSLDRFIHRRTIKQPNAHSHHSQREKFMEIITESLGGRFIE